ncbi:MAG: translation initiation factor eIF2A [Amphiamblys sp. WSBS2006]|nr:MAG: translation initiation factor eIF2A [Amphiamblys sp. WSBS2006]
MNKIVISEKSGFGLVNEELQWTKKIEKKHTKPKQSSTGLYFGAIEEKALAVYRTENMEECLRIHGEVSDFSFSGDETLVCVCEKIVTGEENNIAVWNIEQKERVYTARRETKSQHFQWAGSILATRNSSAINLFSPHTKTKNTLKDEDLVDYSCTDSHPSMCTLSFLTRARSYVCRLYCVGGIPQAISSVSTARTDSAQYFWSPDGQNVIFAAQKEHTAKNYYGEARLFLLGKKSGIRLLNGTNVAVHCIEWAPDSSSFFVVYGNMPAKIEQMDLKGNLLAGWKTNGAKNTARVNRQGTMVFFGGFGNLQGIADVWLLKQKRHIGRLQDQCASDCSWSPDGRSIMTATTTPKMRVANGIRLWSPDAKPGAKEDFDVLCMAEWSRSSAEGQAEAELEQYRAVHLGEEKKAYRLPKHR